MRERSTAVIVIGCLAALVPAATANAATLTTDRACYRSTELMATTITGFPAGSNPTFTGNDVPLRAQYQGGEETFLTGDGTINLQAPYLEVGETHGKLAVKAQITVENPDGLNTFLTATKTVDLVNAFSAFMKPFGATAGAMVTYTITGAVELQPVYLHITRQNYRSSRVAERRTILLGTPKPPCGTLKVRMRVLGVAHPKVGVYSRTVDLHKDIVKDYKQFEPFQNVGPAVYVQPKAPKAKSSPNVGPIGYARAAF